MRLQMPPIVLGPGNEIPVVGRILRCVASTTGLGFAYVLVNWRGKRRHRRLLVLDNGRARREEPVWVQIRSANALKVLLACTVKLFVQGVTHSNLMKSFES
jgi:hypothetical protein